MKEKELPQDGSALARHMTREVCYVKDEHGNYIKKLSSGWKVKNDALDEAWGEVDRQLAEALQMVRDGRKSPIHYFMVKNLMEVSILAQYAGIRKFFVNRHLKPSGFRKLSDEKLQRYADVLDISVDDLKSFDPEDHVL